MSSPKISELPEQERPREKLAALGASVLTDSELIAILLRTGMKGINAVDLARQMLQRFGTLGELARASVKDLSKIKGVGPTKAVQLAAAFGLASRLAREAIGRMPMDRPQLIYDLLGAEMRQLGKESLRIVMLDAKLRLHRTEEVSLGTLNECLAHPRDIFRPVISYGAYAFILVHNHPSGDPSPSDADRRLTSRLLEGARLMQLNFFDHIIVGVPGEGRMPYFSFRDAGIVT
jgi:DNA repair protein RadC